MCIVANVPSPGADHTLRPALSHSVRTTELDSQGGTHPEDKGFFAMELEDSEKEGEAGLWGPGPEPASVRAYASGAFTKRH